MTDRSTIEPTMTEPTIVHNTFVVERSYPVPAERVYAAFADPSQKRRWFVDSSSNAIDTYNLDFRVGGSELLQYRMGERSPFPDVPFSNIISYQVILPGKRIVFANTMAMRDHIFSAALVSVELIPTATGTDVICTHQGAFFEGADGPQMRERGWRTLLDRLGAALEQG